MTQTITKDTTLGDLVEILRAQSMWIGSVVATWSGYEVKMFRRPSEVLCLSSGTGTTIVKAIEDAREKLARTP